MSKIRSPFSALRRIAPAAACAALAALSLTAGAGDAEAAWKRGKAEPGELTPPERSILSDAAANYVRFRQDIGFIEEDNLSSLESTRKAHELLASYAPEPLARGMVAYAALAAAESPDFVAGMQDAIKTYGRKQILDALAQDPRAATGLPGADAAMQRILQVAVADATRLRALGAHVEERALEIQKEPWGRARQRDQQSRLQRLDAAMGARSAETAALSAVRSRGVMAPALASAGDAWSPDWSTPHGAAAPSLDVSGGSGRQLVEQALALAARYALDGVDGRFAQASTQLMQNDKTAQCMSWARLNLDQCIAATASAYEEAFCLGRHGLTEVGGCIDWIAAQGS